MFPLPRVCPAPAPVLLRAHLNPNFISTGLPCVALLDALRCRRWRRRVC